MNSLVKSYPLNTVITVRMLYEKCQTFWNASDVLGTNVCGCRSSHSSKGSRCTNDAVDAITGCCVRVEGTVWYGMLSTAWLNQVTTRSKNKDNVVTGMDSVSTTSVGKAWNRGTFSSSTTADTHVATVANNAVSKERMPYQPKKMLRCDSIHEVRKS